MCRAFNGLSYSICIGVVYLLIVLFHVTNVVLRFTNSRPTVLLHFHQFSKTIYQLYFFDLFPLFLYFYYRFHCVVIIDPATAIYL